jgi:hypothetical protein
MAICERRCPATRMSRLCQALADARLRVLNPVETLWPQKPAAHRSRSFGSMASRSASPKRTDPEHGERDRQTRKDRSMVPSTRTPLPRPAASAPRPASAPERRGLDRRATPRRGWPVHEGGHAWPAASRLREPRTSLGGSYQLPIRYGRQARCAKGRDVEGGYCLR